MPDIRSEQNGLRNSRTHWIITVASFTIHGAAAVPLLMACTLNKVNVYP